MYDYYKILGVSVDADLETIKSAYFALAKKYHPDRGGSHDKMVLIGEAWDILSDPESRRRYDEARTRYCGSDAKSSSAAAADARRARERAEQYAKDWAVFKSLWASVCKDFTEVSYGKTDSELPTAGDSVSGWAFILMGGLIGAVGVGLFYYSKFGLVPWWLGIRMACLGAIVGAWLGRAVHQVIGYSLKTVSASPSPTPSQSNSHIVIPCAKCGQKLRVPVMERDLVVTCGSCKHRFTHTSA